MSFSTSDRSPAANSAPHSWQFRDSPTIQNGAAASGRVDDESLLRRGVRPGVPRLYKSQIPTSVKGIRPHIKFGAIADDAAAYEVTVWNPRENPSPAWMYKTETLDRDREKNDRIVGRSPYETKLRDKSQGYAALKTVELAPDDPACRLMDQLRNFCIYCPNTPTLRGLAPDQQSRDPVGLSGGRLPEAVAELNGLAVNDPDLRELFSEVHQLIDWADSFSPAPSTSVPLSPSAARSKLVVRFVDRYMAKKRNVLTGYDASEGALYVLFAAVLALHPKVPRLLAFDNIDQALNPVLARRLMELLGRWTIESRMSGQWLVTAHNPAVLDGLPLQNDAVRLFAVDRDNRGAATIQRIEISKGLLSKMEKKDWPLSRCWMNGLLGGVPNA